MAVNLAQLVPYNITCIGITMYLSTDMKIVTVQGAILMLHVVIFLFGTQANALVIMAYVRNARLRTVQNTIFLMLAFVDICVTTFVQPTYISAKVYFLMGRLDCFLWDIVLILSTIFLGLSLFTVTILSLQSYVTLAYPFRSQNLITKRRLSRIAIISCFVMAAMILVSVIFKNLSLIAYYLIGIVPVTFLTVIFTWIWTCKLLARHRMVIRTTQTPSTGGCVKRKKIVRSTATAFVVTFSLLGCYSLALAISLGKFIESWAVDNLFIVLFDVCTTLMHSNCLLNPFLLFWRNSGFRETVKRWLSYT